MRLVVAVGHSLCSRSDVEAGMHAAEVMAPIENARIFPVKRMLSEHSMEELGSLTVMATASPAKACPIGADTSAVS